MRPKCFNITLEHPSIPDPRELEASSGGISETSDKKNVQDKSKKQNIALYV
jgi:hypothetical protein